VARAPRALTIPELAAEPTAAERSTRQ